MNNDPVVISGTGIVCSLGATALQVWDSLLSGRSGARKIDAFDTEGFSSLSAYPVHGLDPRDLGINPRDSRIMGLHSLMLMKSGRDAFVHSKLDGGVISGEEIGFFAGMGMVDYDLDDLLPSVLKSLDTEGNLDWDAFYGEAYKEIYPLWPLSMLNNISFCQVAISLGIKGENTVFSPHADSGMQAIAEGVKTVVDGKARVVLAGGVSEAVTLLSLARAHLCGILASEDGSDRLVRPFDVSRGGTILGEGSGVVALEHLSSARARGADCRAAVTGYGAACEPDGRYTGPSSRAFGAAMQRALETAELKASDIDVVIAHGDGTIVGDRNEMDALRDVFSDCSRGLNVFSSKGAIGDLLAGAPVVDLIIALSMMEHGLVPATANTVVPEPLMRFSLVCRESVKRNIRRVLINAQSYEGQAASLVVEALRG